MVALKSVINLMIGKLLCVFILGLINYQCGYSQKLEWANEIEAFHFANVGTSKTDNLGNLYVYGWYSDSLVFYDHLLHQRIESILESGDGGGDFFLAKYNNTGRLTWVKSFGNTGHDVSFNISIDKDNEILITGTFEGKVDFNPSGSPYTLTSKGKMDLFLAKYDTSCNLLWINQISGINLSHYNFKIKNYGQTNYLTMSFLAKKLYLNDDLLSDSLISGSLFAKFDDFGKLLWFKIIKGFVCICDFDVDESSNLFFTGEFNDNVDFDPGDGQLFLSTGTYNNINVFIAKFDSIGKPLWVKNIGGSKEDRGEIIQINKQKEIFVLGKFEDLVDFDPNIGEFNLKCKKEAKFIARFSSNGALIDARQLPEEIFDLDFLIDRNNDLYFYGSFIGSMDIDLGSEVYEIISNESSADLFISRYNSELDFKWAYRLGSKRFDNIGDIDFDKSYNMYLTGHSGDTIDVDLSEGVYNLNIKIILFITKYSPFSINYDTITICKGDTFYFNNKKLTSTGDYSEIFNKWLGGDSVVYLNLKVNPSYQLNKLIKICFGEIYQFPDGTTSIDAIIDTSYFKTYNACDSLIITDLEVIEPDSSVYQIGISLVAKDSLCDYFWFDCIKSEIINGERRREFTAKTKGSVALIIKKGNCYDTSSCYEIGSEVLFFIPNTFTPNNDGLNDFFKPEGVGILNYKIKIYNRWGEKLFEGDENIFWDGKFKGETVAVGVYYYRIELKTTYQNSILKAGTVSVLN